MASGWDAFWGWITPWQTDAEEGAGLEGTWGSGEYLSGDAGKAFGTSQKMGDESEDPRDILRNTNFRLMAEDARDAAYDTYGIEIDPETGERITKTASEMSAEAQALSEGLPSFTEWLAEQGIELGDISGQLSGLDALTQQLAAGPTDEDYDNAYANAARLMGLDPAEADLIMGALSKQLAGYEEGMTEEELMESGVLDNFSGMSEEEMRLRQRQNQANIRMAEQRAQRLVQDSLADTGSTARMLQTADEATMQINNMQLQQDASLAQEDFERQLAQFESQKQVWGQMLETRQIGVQQYMQNMQQSMGMAMQGYSQQIDAILGENQQYLQQYGADFNALQTQVQNLYAAANLQLGIDQAAIDAMTDLYNQAVDPILDQVEALMLADELDFTLEDFISLSADIASIIGEFI